MLGWKRKLKPRTFYVCAKKNVFFVATVWNYPTPNHNAYWITASSSPFYESWGINIERAYPENCNGVKWKNVTNSNTQIPNFTGPWFAAQASLPPMSGEVVQALSEDSVTLFPCESCLTQGAYVSSQDLSSLMRGSQGALKKNSEITSQKYIGNLSPTLFQRDLWIFTKETVHWAKGTT